MGQSAFARNCTAAAVTAGIAASPLFTHSGRAQPPGLGYPTGPDPFSTGAPGPGARAASSGLLGYHLPNRDQDPAVTTVTPLTVKALAPVPDVGPGATYFLPEELKAVAAEARKEEIDARDAVEQCHPPADGRRPKLESWGDFDIEALYATETAAQAALQRGAQAAADATQAALDARRASAQGNGSDAALKSTELARQAAVKAFQTAQAAMSEAQFRIADFQQEVELNVSGVPQWSKANSIPALSQDDQTLRAMGIQAFVDEQTRRRGQDGAAGGIYVPEEFKDLRLSDIVAHQADDKGQAVIKLSGKIINPRKSAIAVPPIWVSVVDKFGTSLKSEQAEAPHADHIPAGGSVPFTYEVKPMPDKTERTVVTFAPMHHVPTYMPVSAFCSPEGGGFQGEN